MKRNQFRFGFLFLAILLVVPSFGQMGNEFAYYRLGIKYKKEKKFDKAIEAFRKVLAVYPDNFNSYFQIAEIRVSQNKYGLAAYELKKSLEYKPNWPDAQYLLAKCYEKNQNYEKALIEWRKFTQISKDPNKKAEAEARIQELLAIIKRDNPESQLVAGTGAAAPRSRRPAPAPDKGSGIYADPEYRKGVEYFTQKKYDQAVAQFRKTLKKHPGHAGAYYYAGVIRYEQKKLKMAAINFRKSFSFPELGFNAHFYLGLINEKLRKIQPAIKEFREYIKLTKSAAGKREARAHIKRLQAMAGKEPPSSPEPAEAPRMLPLPTKPYVYQIDDLLAFVIDDTTVGDGRMMMDAVHLFREGKYDEAMKKFKTVSLRNPKGILADDAVYNVGICYMKLRLYENAHNQFDHLTSTYPETKLVSKADYLKGIAELEKDEFASAEKVFRKWIRSYPKSELLPRAYARLGDALVKQDMIKDGIEAYRAGIPFFKDPRRKLPVMYAIGENYENIDLPTKAAEYYREILKLGKNVGTSPYIRDAYLKLGDQHYRKKEYNKAKEYYDVMAGSYPNSPDVPWAKFQIGNIYRHKNLLDSAIDLYTELIRDYPDSYWAKQAKWKLDDTVWQNDYKEALQ